MHRFWEIRRSGSAQGRAVTDSCSMQKTPITPSHVFARFTRLEDIAVFFLIGIVALSPIPLGANRPLAWDILGLAVGLALVLYFASTRNNALRFDRELTVPLILFVVVVAYALFQVAHFTPAAWHDAIWQQAGSVLQRKLDGAIAVDRQAALQHALRLTSYGAVFFLSSSLCKDSRRAHISVSAIALVGCLYAIYGLVVYWSGNTTILWMKKWAYQDSLSATFVNRNSAATFFGLCSLVLLVRVSMLLKPIARASGDRRDRLFYYVNFLSRHAWPIIGLFLVITACVLTHSRAGFTATMGGWIVFLSIVVRSIKVSAKQQLAAIAAILAIAVFASLISGQITFDRLSDLGISDDDQGGRFQVYAIMMHMIAHRPFLGIGLGSFAPAFETIRPSSVVPYYNLAHNDYLQDSLELGIPAAFCLFLAVAWLIGICIRGIRVRRRETALPGLGVAASTLVLLHSTLDFSLQIPAITTTYMFILGIGVAQSRSSRRRAPSENPALKDRKMLFWFLPR